MLRLSLCVFLLCSWVATASTACGQETTYQLPKDPKAIVISYDEQNGFTLPRQDNAALLTIFADGTVNMPDVYGTSRDVTGKIDQQELQELLRFAIGANKFFEFDMDRVKAKMQEAEKQREIPQIADVPDSVFEIQIADQRHTVRHYALGMASEYPEIAELQQLRAIQQRLQKLMSETRVGGKAGIEKLLKLANEELKKEHPDVKALTVENFQGAYLRDDGMTSATFSRMGMTADNRPDGTFVVAILQIPEEGKPQVTLRIKSAP